MIAAALGSAEPYNGRCADSTDGMRCTRLDGHDGDHTYAYADVVAAGYVRPPF